MANLPLQRKGGGGSNSTFDPKIFITYFTYCDFKVKTEDITYISLQQEIEVDSQRCNVTPCIMIYFTYRDLKATTNDITNI